MRMDRKPFWVTRCDWDHVRRGKGKASVYTRGSTKSNEGQIRGIAPE